VAIVPLPELDALAGRLAPARYEPFAQQALARAYEEFVARRRGPLAAAAVSTSGTEYPTFYALIEDRKANLAELEIRLDPAPPPGPAWDFLLPFERIAFHADGSADLYPPGAVPPVRAIARLALREHFLIRTREDEERAASGGTRVGLPSNVATLDAGLGACRDRGLIPFAVAILLYFPDRRVRYEFDLVHTTLLPDPRAGRLSVHRRVGRPTRLSWGVDQTIGRGELSFLQTRCLEVLVESNGLTSVELSHVFGGVREMVDSAVQGLVARRLVTFDGRTQVYRPRLSAYLPSREPSVEAYAAGPDPSLHTSVQELIAAADARATCPLCGAALPPGPRGILCAECTAKVGAA
jgi:hypothetical protein